VLLEFVGDCTVLLEFVVIAAILVIVEFVLAHHPRMILDVLQTRILAMHHDYARILAACSVDTHQQFHMPLRQHRHCTNLRLHSFLSQARLVAEIPSLHKHC